MTLIDDGHRADSGRMTHESAMALIEAVPPRASLSMTASIVAAYVAGNAVPVSALPSLVASVHATLASLASPVSERNGADTAIDAPSPPQG